MQVRANWLPSKSQTKVAIRQQSLWHSTHLPPAAMLDGEK
jgi:hypothetical protein